MTWLLWLGLVLCVLTAAKLGLAVVGAKRWANTTQALALRLEASRTDSKAQLPPATRYNARELEGLPEPVQRYFRAVLKDGQPIIAAVTIELAGSFNLAAGGEQWKPFTSRQRVAAQRPGFLWNAKVSMLPGVTVRVIDSYIAGEGLLRAAVLVIPSMCHQINRERQIWSSLCTSRSTKRRIQQLTFWLIKTRSGLT